MESIVKIELEIAYFLQSKMVSFAIILQDNWDAFCCSEGKLSGR